MRNGVIIVAILGLLLAEIYAPTYKSFPVCTIQVNESGCISL